MVNKKNKVSPTSLASAAYGKKTSFWSKTKWVLGKLIAAFLDVLFLLSVIAIFGSIFLIIWDPVTANFQLFGTSVLFLVFLMTMIGIFNQD